MWFTVRKEVKNQMNKSDFLKLINLKKSMKLGNVEKRILVALLIQRKQDYSIGYPEGNDIRGIAKFVYGIVEPQSEGLYMNPSNYSSLSATLHKLFKKGLVKMCIPVYHRRWIKEDKDHYISGHIDRKGSRELKLLVKEYDIPDKYEEICPKWNPYSSESTFDIRLPYRTHKWWMLTERGKEIALHLLNRKGGESSVKTADR